MMLQFLAAMGFIFILWGVFLTKKSKNDGLTSLSPIFLGAIFLGSIILAPIFVGAIILIITFVLLILTLFF